MATAPTAKRTPKQRRGDYFEKLAADKLSQAGLTIITTNYDAYTDGKKLGEIDIIATHSVTQRGRTLDYLVFIVALEDKESWRKSEDWLPIEV